MPLDSIGITNLLSIPKTPLKSFLRSRVRVPPQHAIFHRPFLDRSLLFECSQNMFGLLHRHAGDHTVFLVVSVG